MATNKMCVCGCGSDNGSCGQFVEVPVTWLPNYMPRTTLDRVLMASIQEPPDVPVRPELIAALEAVARAAEEYRATHVAVAVARAKVIGVGDAVRAAAKAAESLDRCLSALREARR